MEANSKTQVFAKLSHHLPDSLYCSLLPLWWWRVGFVLGLGLLLVVGGCTLPVENDLDDTIGRETPTLLVSDFFTDFNQALQDPQLDDEEIREIWALRLASYFAPSEQVVHRQALSHMLANFAYGSAQFAENQRLIVEILYSDITVKEHGNHALVALVKGEVRLRRVRIEPNGTLTVQSDQRVPLSTVLGDYSEALPALRVNERWFLTEVRQPMV